MSFAAALAAIGARRDDPAALADLAEAALADGEEAAALDVIVPAARICGDARLWQWAGLLQRALDWHKVALSSFANAASLDPNGASIAHGRAHVALEAGEDAVALFETAWRLAPANGQVLIGLAAARTAAGEGEAAAAELDRALLAAPMWIEGHAQLAQLRATLGRADQATASVERAIAAAPRQAALWTLLFDLLIRQSDFAGLRDAVARASAAGLGDALSFYAAIAAAELGDVEGAERGFRSAPPETAPALAIWRIRHLLRTGDLAQAIRLIDRELQGPGAARAWPYAAAAWRLTNDPRWQWLEGDARLVTVTDLTAALPPLALLADRLRSLHLARGEYLDQSVRRGTQTDGPLFSRIDPEIRAVRAAVVEAVDAHVAQLPPPDPRHPLLGQRRDRRLRFGGSWSVRLRGSGYHSNHVHPQGWISSALYVALPDGSAGEDANGGWLALGQPQAELGLELDPFRLVEPRPGRLVLFPSWMWHGTVPFAQGERLTIAFDVALPR